MCPFRAATRLSNTRRARHWRTWAAGLPWDPALTPVAALSDVERGVLARQLETGFQTVPCSGFSHLDAVAALAGVRQSVSYEAQAAIN